VGYNNCTGKNNVFLGICAGFSGNFNNSIAIGAYAQPNANGQLALASSLLPLGTSSAGTFSFFLNARINGIDLKIPLYF
jgi:hypothetical protein